MEAPSKESFELQKVSIPNGGGLSVEFKYGKSMRDEYHEFEDKHQSSVEPHPDLVARIRSLKGFYLEVTRMRTIYKVIFQDRFGASKEQQEIAKAALDELQRYVKITKISLSGKEDNSAVIITGVVEAETGQGMAYNTHRVKLNEEVYGWEENLKQIIEEIHDEVYEYIYGGKVLAPDMFDNSLADVDEGVNEGNGSIKPNPQTEPDGDYGPNES